MSYAEMIWRMAIIVDVLYISVELSFWNILKGIPLAVCLGFYQRFRSMFAQQQMFDRNLSRHVVKTKPMSFFSAFTQSIIFFHKESVLDICPFFVYFYLNCRS